MSQGDDALVESINREIESPNTKGRSQLQDIDGTLGGSVPVSSATPKPRTGTKIDFVDARM